MKVFIDTNAYLSFFVVDPNLPALLEFKKLLDDKNSKIQLIVSQQTLDEYDRNVGNRMEQSRQTIQKSTFSVDIQVSEAIKEAKDKFADDIKKITEKIENFKKKKLEDLEKSFLETEKVISEIFSLGENIPITEEIIAKAKERNTRGNPPRKRRGGSSEDSDTSYGDAIHWESLLANINDNLIVISSDPDYTESQKGEKIINRFLKKEWDKKGKTINLYSHLGIFINGLKKKEVFSKEEIEKEIRSSNIISIQNPLAYRIVTEERVFPISGVASSVFSGPTGYTVHSVKADDGGYLRVSSDMTGPTGPLDHLTLYQGAGVDMTTGRTTILSDSIAGLEIGKGTTINNPKYLGTIDITDNINPIKTKKDEDDKSDSKDKYTI